MSPAEIGRARGRAGVSDQRSKAVSSLPGGEEVGYTHLQSCWRAKPLLQPGHSHWKGRSAVCERRWPAWAETER